MKRRDGFTLAEVLITLTIIGVISALTLPAIQSNTAASRNRATLKNTMAILSQAAQNNMATEGWNFAHVNGNNHCCYNDGENQNAFDNDTICGLLNSNLSGENYLGALNDGRPQNNQYRVLTGANELPGSAAWFASYQLANGAIIGLRADSNSCIEEHRTDNPNSRTWCGGYIDVNGLAGPNRTIKCSNGTARYLWNDENATCEVERTTNADLFPIIYYDNTIELSSDAARAFLNAR